MPGTRRESDNRTQHNAGDRTLEKTMDRDIVEVLNEALAIDPRAVSYLFLECEITCEPAFGQHDRFAIGDGNSLRVLGLLQGLLNPPEVIVMLTDDAGERVLQFCYGTRDESGRVSCRAVDR
jgi:hypothetical protein